MKVIEGIVQKGYQRGKGLGFPTINIPLSEAVDEGIYISHIIIKDKQYNALTFIGSAKTFGQTEVLAETYIFDFSEDVYGKFVTITLIKKLRDNQKFDSAEELVKQMEEDRKNALAFFNNPINK